VPISAQTTYLSQATQHNDCRGVENGVLLPVVCYPWSRRPPRLASAAGWAYPAPGVTIGKLANGCYCGGSGVGEACVIGRPTCWGQ